MCGIAGLLGADDAPLVRRMIDSIAHRGPDGSGLWTDEGVTLGHRRLAILDVERGAQPMTDASGRYTIVYNGECYNHLLLRPGLEAAGADFQTTTDTETILEGFRVWGERVVERMEGMFAFAVWDAQQREMFIARDPWGIKPFFYAVAGGQFAFASEQKALLLHPGVTPAPDLDRVRERAALEFLTGQATLFRDVHQLPPGTWARLRPGQQATCHDVAWQPYYQVAAEAFDSTSDAGDAIRERFVDSVREQLLSDVPLGVILSGGLDSAAVATVHQRLLSDAPIHTFTIAESEDVEDFRAARRLAEHLGTDHRETTFDLDTVIADMPRYTWHNENINYTEFFFLPLFEFMRKTVTVGLCGQGSDELWGGYGRYREPQRLARERLARLRASCPAHLEHLSVQVLQNHTSGSALAEWDQQGQLNNFQLRLVDRNSMAHSLEVRVPFLSKPLHQASRAVPWAWKMHDNTEKWILRKGLEGLGAAGLPKNLLWRPKVPAGRATSPKVMDRFEAEAARLVSPRAMEKHPLAGTFAAPAEQLVYDLWHELFVEGADWRKVALADLA